MSNDVEMTGGIFENPAGIMKDFETELKKTLAQKVNELVHRNFTVFKNPTGYYESRVSVERNEVVTDHGVVYGSWLEKGGKGFSGYHSFERAAEDVQNQAEQIGESLLSSKYIRRLD